MEDSHPPGFKFPVEMGVDIPWRAQHSADISAPAAKIWKLFTDVPGWKKWNPGIEEIEIHGPFEEGTEFTMKVPGQDPFGSIITVVEEGSSFVDETQVGDIMVIVSHYVMALEESRSRVVFITEVWGVGAAEVGPGVSDDFPEVLRGLAEIAEGG